MTSKGRRTPVVVAIDGPAGAGKSTVAKRLARALGYQVLDTGAIYRAVALEARRRDVSWDDEPGCAGIAGQLDIAFRADGDINRVFLAGAEVTADIRTPDISKGASRVSALPEVRAALLDLQRRLGERGGVSAEGRDVGTVVFPGAEVKFFLTASPGVRARRRFDELQGKGAGASLKATEAEMRDRDQRDSGRAVAPLARAEDAVEVDSSGLDIEQVVDSMIEIVRRREKSSRSGHPARA